MKKIFFTLLGVLCSTFLFSQNGGQSSENPTLKIEWVSQLANNMNVIKVTNKLNCTADITLIYNGNRTKTVGALSSDTFHVVLYQTCVLRAHSNPTCIVPDSGNVELNLCSILPVKLKYLNVIKISEHEYEVVFELEDKTNLKNINIQILDGNKWKNVEFVLTEEIKQNKIFRKKIKI